MVHDVRALLLPETQPAQEDEVLLWDGARQAVSGGVAYEWEGEGPS